MKNRTITERTLLKGLDKNLMGHMICLCQYLDFADRAKELGHDNIAKNWIQAARDKQREITCVFDVADDMEVLVYDEWENCIRTLYRENNYK